MAGFSSNRAIPLVLGALICLALYLTLSVSNPTVSIPVESNTVRPSCVACEASCPCPKQEACPTCDACQPCGPCPTAPSASEEFFAALKPLAVLLAHDGKLHSTQTRTSPPFTIYVLPPTDGNSQGLLQHGRWLEPAVSDFVDYYLPRQPPNQGPDGKPPLCVDLGANLGFFTLNFASKGYRVVAVEAQPRLTALNRLSIAANGFDKLISYYPNALSDKGGEVLKMSINLDNSGASHVRGGGDTSVVTVTLDEIVKEPVHVMKIDVEGFEAHVLRGGVNVFKNLGVKYLVMEYDRNWLKDDGPFILNTLTSWGYELCDDTDFKRAASPETRNRIENLRSAITIYFVRGGCAE